MPAAHLRTNQPAPKPYKGIAMEGPIAKWYTNVRERDQELGAVVREVNEILPAGSRILEVAPGPGYLAIELAKIGKYQIVGLDISKSFVEIAQTKAKEAGVAVDFRHGNASNMPFDVDSFDLMSPSGNGRKSLAFRRSLQVDDPLAPPAEAGGLQSR
jgi:SAM-dependent methyltransferase